MATVNQNFSATGAGAQFSVKAATPFAYSVSGTFSGSWALQYSDNNGATWGVVTSGSAARAEVMDARGTPGSDVKYRFVCTARASGTIITQLVDMPDLDTSPLATGTPATLAPFKEGFVNVVDFGADPTGAEPLNRALNRALEHGDTVFIPGSVDGQTQATWRLADWVPPRPGCKIIGQHTFGLSGPYYGTLIKKHSSATVAVFDLSDDTYARGTSIKGVVVDGVDRAVDGIKQGADNLAIEHVTVLTCDEGFGGSYSQTSTFINCVAYNNNIGFRNQVDCYFYGCRATYNRLYGIRWEGGATANDFHGRVEWNGYGDGTSTGGNVSLFESKHNNIHGLIDAGYDYGVRSVRATATNIFACMRRNGRSDNATPGLATHLYLTGSTGINFFGTMVNGVDDEGAPPTTPKYAVVLDGGASSPNNRIRIVGYIEAGTVQSVYETGVASTNVVIQGTTDGADRDAYADPEVAALAGLTSAQDMVPIFTGSGTASTWNPQQMSALASGYVIPPYLMSTTAGSSTVVDSRAFSCLFRVGRTLTATGLAVKIATAGTSCTGKAALYRLDGATYTAVTGLNPTGVAVNSTGNVQLTFDAPVSLSPGWYVGVVAFSGTTCPIVTSVSSSATSQTVHGYANLTDFATTNTTGMIDVITYADGFNASPSFTRTTSSNVPFTGLVVQ